MPTGPRTTSITPSGLEDRTRRFGPAEFAALDGASGRDSPADYLKALALRELSG